MKKDASLCNDQCLTVCIQNLTFGLYSFITVATFLKLWMVITTIDLYPYILPLETFDLYLGHEVSAELKWVISISEKLLIWSRLILHLGNRHQKYIICAGFVRRLYIQGEIIMGGKLDKVHTANSYFKATTGAFSYWWFLLLLLGNCHLFSLLCKCMIQNESISDRQPNWRLSSAF